MFEISWAILVLASATLFLVLWFLDALTHKKIVETEISKTELQTHRNILITSVLMELSLVGMYWNKQLMLIFFIAFFITRTAHEFIDELKYHADRCSSYENYLHLGMWITVLIKTGALFYWGYFLNYISIEELPMILYVWGVIVIALMSYVGLKEWQR